MSVHKFAYERVSVVELSMSVLSEDGCMVVGDSVYILLCIFKKKKRALSKSLEKRYLNPRFYYYWRSTGLPSYQPSVRVYALERMCEK